MPFLFCNISWMTKYQGQYNSRGVIVDQPSDGGKYVQDNNEAHESCNFLADSNSFVYGYVSTWRANKGHGKHTEIKIENLGASKGDSFIDGVNVIWIAKHPEGGKRVVGWYKNARVYRNLQKHNDSFSSKQHDRDKIDTYRIICSKKNVHLIEKHDRQIKLDPNNTRKGWPGRSSIFFPNKHKFNIELNSLIETLKNLIENEQLKAQDSEIPPYREGKEKLVLHKKKERSIKLVKEFKAQLTDFSCTVCGFSFEQFYGSLGEKYIEAHHIIPIAKITESTEVTISDLVAVCSNCHRMLHRSTKITNVKQLMDVIKKKRNLR
jgi:5-methylcytosine-specific restriction protein A